MKRIELAFCFVALFVFTAEVIAGNYYKWVGDNGVTHVTLEPPKDRPSKILSVQGRSSSSTYDPSPAIKLTKEKDQDKKDLEKLKAQERENEAAQEAECKKAKSQLATVSAGSRVRIKDKDGNERPMTPEEMLEKKKASQQYIEKYCKSQSAKAN